ncbi:hypothetical protein BEWA_036960 [Theileria equi strain WA]|uniref:Uncharacterized protein n=1 Tax=Theileria equi strain WA TaxID=1537102 RepID=L1LEI0_THEEQ|nr:hypothetical protein BEWA_036960 [Theileria equi strain WA]EKX73660.1 hypothetical protein BEWA_036960 [Theileria equi strain WA]|eukprot:XP_004833112.1 hypothetical protein BEWA_036960 [Theileria equi strain WA]
MTVPSSGVTIDISHKPDGPGPDTYGGPNQVKLTKEENPPNSGFVKLTHVASSGGLFNVEKVQYGNYGRDITEIKPTNNEPIKSYSVWYHSGDTDHNQPLLIEIYNKGDTYDYRETKDTGWTSFGGDPQSTRRLEYEKLEQKLDDLNCQHYKFVTIDLTESHSKTHASNGEGYCCGKDHTGDKKVAVKGGKVDKGASSSEDIEYYKHEVTYGTSISGIYYKDDSGERKRIKIPGIDNSGKDSLKLYTFYNGDIPRLIYVDSTGNDLVTGWYEPSPTGGDNQQWEKLQSIPEITMPDDIKAGKGSNYNQHIEILKCIISGTGGKCTDTPPPSSQLSVGGSGAVDGTSGSIAGPMGAAGELGAQKEANEKQQESLKSSEESDTNTVYTVSPGKSSKGAPNKDPKVTIVGPTNAIPVTIHSILLMAGRPVS